MSVNDDVARSKAPNTVKQTRRALTLGHPFIKEEELRLATKIRRPTLPEIPDVLGDVGEDISNELSRLHLTTRNGEYSSTDMTAMYTLDATTDAYLIGDIHGDVRALVQVLHKLPCFNVPQHILTQVDGNVNRCVARPEHFSRAPRDSLERVDLSDIKWDHAYSRNSIVIILGDLIDNRRTGDQGYPGGMCAFSNSELEILKCVSVLCQPQSNSKNVCRWVIGNHDIGNVLDEVDCNFYAPVDYCNREGKFVEARKELVRAYLLRAKAVAVANIHGILCSHGGICRKFVNMFKSKNRITGADVLTTTKINRMYVKMIAKREAHIDRLRNSKYWPDWCRPVTDPAFSWKECLEALQFIRPPVSSMVVAHVIQNSGINCAETPIADGIADTGDPSGDDDTEFKVGELCRIDIGMSHVFQQWKSHDNKFEFGYLKLFLNKDAALRRKIVSWVSGPALPPRSGLEPDPEPPDWLKLRMKRQNEENAGETDKLEETDKVEMTLEVTSNWSNKIQTRRFALQRKHT